MYKLNSKTKNQESRIILGIDPGIADTGFGVIQKNRQDNLKCLAYGSIKTKAGIKLERRLELLHLELDEIIKKYKPDLISVEELFFCNNIKTALVVGQARGVVMLTAQLNKIQIIEFTPLQIKQAVSSYGKANKKQVQQMVKLILNLETIPKPDDAADALAAAICGSNNGHIIKNN
ncbi:crossover junction endodeoxyribonuclease RuvC [Candidatus Parcubacteria bacterium]|nr:crossover junction endodeoxyribonuclease RuvC [Candidatus Parcubacteria bacterium]